jgi:hypothetical protein
MRPIRSGSNDLVSTGRRRPAQGSLRLGLLLSRRPRRVRTRHRTLVATRPGGASGLGPVRMGSGSRSHPIGSGRPASVRHGCCMPVGMFIFMCSRRPRSRLSAVTSPTTRHPRGSTSSGRSDPAWSHRGRTGICSARPVRVKLKALDPFRLFGDVSHNAAPPSRAAARAGTPAADPALTGASEATQTRQERQTRKANFPIC